MDKRDATQLHQLDAALWAALDAGEGLPAVLVADSVLGCAAATGLAAGLTEQQVVDSVLRAMRRLQQPATHDGVMVLPVTPADA